MRSGVRPPPLRRLSLRRLSPRRLSPRRLLLRRLLRLRRRSRPATADRVRKRRRRKNPSAGVYIAGGVAVAYVAIGVAFWLNRRSVELGPGNTPDQCKAAFLASTGRDASAFPGQCVPPSPGWIVGWPMALLAPLLGAGTIGAVPCCKGCA